MPRVDWINQFGSKGPTLGFAHPTAAYLHPLLTGSLVSGERDERPRPSILTLHVHRDRVTGSQTLPSRVAHDDRSGG
ncbi:MAG: hypothetical protein B7X07_00250 [Actinobacteria bacterium 21-64-8]|nr:MAG: hypothetical protein B7X07_00250 [Actinobacteria bacterium 21-64-8]